MADPNELPLSAPLCQRPRAADSVTGCSLPVHESSMLARPSPTPQRPLLFYPNVLQALLDSSMLGEHLTQHELENISREVGLDEDQAKLAWHEYVKLMSLFEQTLPFRAEWILRLFHSKTLNRHIQEAREAQRSTLYDQKDIDAKSENQIMTMDIGVAPLDQQINTDTSPRSDRLAGFGYNLSHCHRHSWQPISLDMTYTTVEALRSAYPDILSPSSIMECSGELSSIGSQFNGTALDEEDIKAFGNFCDDDMPPSTRDTMVRTMSWLYTSDNERERYLEYRASSPLPSSLVLSRSESTDDGQCKSSSDESLSETGDDDDDDGDDGNGKSAGGHNGDDHSDNSNNCAILRRSQPTSPSRLLSRMHIAAD